MRALLPIVLITLAFAGCLEGTPDEEPSPTTPVAPLGAQTVVAVIDTGVNLYHNHFRTDEILTDAQLQQFTVDGVAPVRIQLTLGDDYEENIAADEETLESLDGETLYYFEGTRIFGYSFGSQIPVLDDNGASHGTAVIGSVLDANPDAWVVMVEAGQGGDGEAWAAQQPWIDFLSESYGPPFSPPIYAVLGSGTSEGNRQAYLAGKLVFGASDNSPALSPGDGTSGPPWVVAIAGDHPENGCRETNSGNVPDFTADWTQELPEAYSVDGYRTISGTSFATPTSAGVASRVLLEVRQAWGHDGGIENGTMAFGPEGQRLSHNGLRDALNHTAYYFTSTETCVGDAPVNPAAPWVQMGWGHLGPDVINATVAHILGEEAPDKPQAAQDYMATQYDARKQAWGEA